MRKLSIISAALTILILCLNLAALAGPKDPIAGELFDSLYSRQYPDFQSFLESVVSESDGNLVTGPIEVALDSSELWQWIYGSVRIICPDLETLNQTVSALNTADSVSVSDTRIYSQNSMKEPPVGFRGVLMEARWHDRNYRIQLTTIQQTRWLLWARLEYAPDYARMTGTDRANLPMYLKAYKERVSDHLFRLDNGAAESAPPAAADLNLPASFDLYAPPPDYIIQGYQNYLDFLYAHSEIRTDFACGVTAFIPTDSLMRAIIDSAPREAFPNKEAPMLQQEYRKFFQRKGDLRVMETLTREGFDTLRTGEYFFAVSICGEIRFGRELLRSEVERIETETGTKVPRANHAFLFPGEPVLTAGAFFIERDEMPRLVKVTAQSGHYFYSNISGTIREDISTNSNHYLLTLGHFFKALDELDIEYDNVLISKF